MCTTILIGKAASEHGSVIVGHNEDTSGQILVREHFLPAGEEHENKIRFEPGSAELTLPRKRQALYWLETCAREIDGSASFCDSYVNESGVVVCSNNCGLGGAREENVHLLDGGIGYGLRWITAGGAKSSYNAVEIAASLIDKYGYLGAGRSYNFADKNEIWVLQVVKGRGYAIKQVPDDEVFLIPNHYTIRTPDKHSADFALPAQSDFARTYQKNEDYRAQVNLHRHWRGLECLTGEKVDVGEELPFSVKPKRKIGVDDVQRVLRYHYEGTPDDVSGGGDVHKMHTRPICADSTIYSFIVQLGESAQISRVIGRPCMSEFGVPLSENEELSSEKILRDHFGGISLCE